MEQIDKYYRHKLRTFDLIYIGMTPDILVKYRAHRLPIVVQQSTITKCIRSRTGSRSAHEMPRNIIESLPDQIETKSIYGKTALKEYLVKHAEENNCT